MNTPQATTYASRLDRTRQALGRNLLDAFLVTEIHNVRYLTGFSGSAGLLLITLRENFLITDFRYKEQAGKEVHGWDILIEEGNRLKILQSLSRKNGIKRLGFESSVSYDFFSTMAPLGMTLKATKGLIEKLRAIKDAEEIEYIRQAVLRAEAAFLEVKRHIRRGADEMSIALRLEEKLKRKGCRHIPFEIIVASGPRSAMPHAKPSGRRLQEGDLVIIDWGGEAYGYYSDMTRTVLLKGGSDLSQKKNIYRTVLQANEDAISSVTSGVSSKKVDAAARDFIRKAGYGEFFGHGTGHGVGIEVHEAPRISWTKSERIRKHMVFTVEPGIYLPGIGGVRIEDMVLVERGRTETLTHLPKTLELIG